MDRTDNLLIADSWNSRTLRVARLGTITTVAGTGERGFSGDNGPAVDAQLNGPDGLALDASGNLFIGDARNHRIRILTQTRPADTLPAPTDLTATTVSSSRIDLTWRDNSHDGDTGQLVRTVNQLTVPARGWRQVNRILAQYAPGTRQG